MCEFLKKIDRYSKNTQNNSTKFPFQIFVAICFAVLAVSLAQEADKVADKADTPLVASKFPSFRKFETSPTKRYCARF